MRLLSSQAVSELVGECEAVMSVAPDTHISVILVLPWGPNPSVLSFQLCVQTGNVECSQAPHALLH